MNDEGALMESRLVGGYREIRLGCRVGQCGSRLNRVRNHSPCVMYGSLDDSR